VCGVRPETFVFGKNPQGCQTRDSICTPAALREWNSPYPALKTKRSVLGSCQAKPTLGFHVFCPRASVPELLPTRVTPAGIGPVYLAGPGHPRGAQKCR